MKDVSLNNPNLPDSDVTETIVSFSDKALINTLLNLGVNCTLINKNTDLEPSVSSHADLGAYHLGKGKFIVSNSFENTRDYNVLKTVNVFSPYPNDCLLNAADIGDYLICNKKITDNLILEEAYKSGKIIIDVKQGYAKCSVCIVKHNVIITDDESIYRKISFFKEISALLISKGSIELKGQNYGFIGGTSGLIGKDKIIFNGDLSYHKDFLAIKEFLDYHNVRYIDIKNKPLLDVGSIIPIKEKGE